MRPTFATLCLVLFAGCSAFGLRRDLDALLQPYEDHAVQVAALVVDLDSGETLCSQHPRRLLRPASTMKLLTTASTCSRELDAAVVTELVADATPRGAVTLIGGGDPFLSSAELRALVGELARRGVTGVDGAVITIVDPLLDAARFGEGWMWDDEPFAFMPPLSAAAVDGGCITVAVRGVADSIEASLLPVPGPFALEVRPAEGELRVTRGLYRDPERVTVSGSIAAEATVSRRITVPDPARYTAAVLTAALADAGLLNGEPEVVIGNTAPALAADAPRVTLRRPLAEVVRRTNKVSDNLGAELLLRRLGTLEGGASLDPGAAARGLAIVRADLERLGLDPDGYRIADGSGVSHYTLVSAEALVAVLVAMHHRGGQGFAAFESSLPVAGRDGTLSGRMQGTAAAERVHAKTGTISGVSNLAGYVTTTSGRHLAFAIMVQNFVGSAAPWRKLQDEFCARLAEL